MYWMVWSRSAKLARGPDLSMMRICRGQYVSFVRAWCSEEAYGGLLGADLDRGDIVRGLSGGDEALVEDETGLDGGLSVELSRERDLQAGRVSAKSCGVANELSSP